MRRVLQRSLFGLAILLLAYCGFVLGDSWSFEKKESIEFDQLLAARLPLSDKLPGMPRGLLGRIEIARLGVSVMIMEGTTANTLRRAAGHIVGTALPGQVGNVGIAAHRDTFFLPIENIRTDDTITLTTLAGEFRYRVVSTKVVTPRDVAVLKPGADEILTLVTCYPFHFVGSAPGRFIVRAERIM